MFVRVSACLIPLVFSSLTAIADMSAVEADLAIVGIIPYRDAGLPGEIVDVSVIVSNRGSVAARAADFAVAVFADGVALPPKHSVAQDIGAGGSAEHLFSLVLAEHPVWLSAEIQSFATADRDLSNNRASFGYFPSPVAAGRTDKRASVAPELVAAEYGIGCFSNQWMNYIGFRNEGNAPTCGQDAWVLYDMSGAYRMFLATGDMDVILEPGAYAPIPIPDLSGLYYEVMVYTAYVGGGPNPPPDDPCNNAYQGFGIFGGLHGPPQEPPTGIGGWCDTDPPDPLDPSNPVDE